MLSDLFPVPISVMAYYFIMPMTRVHFPCTSAEEVDYSPHSLIPLAIPHRRARKIVQRKLVPTLYTVSPNVKLTDPRYREGEQNVSVHVYQVVQSKVLEVFRQLFHAFIAVDLVLAMDVVSTYVHQQIHPALQCGG